MNDFSLALSCVIVECIQHLKVKALTSIDALFRFSV